MNNIVFITGASSDLGLELIRKMNEKCIIVAHYNSSDSKLLELQKEIKNIIIPLQAEFPILVPQFRGLD